MTLKHGKWGLNYEPFDEGTSPLRPKPTSSQEYKSTCSCRLC